MRHPMLTRGPAVSAVGAPALTGVNSASKRVQTSTSPVVRLT